MPVEGELHRARSAAETEVLGASLAGGLSPGDVVLVAGELGAGKSTFVRGACRALGVRGPVTSPTFTLGHLHPAAVPVAHLDLYRVANLDNEDPELLADYLRPDTIAFVEWPQGAEAQLAALGRITHRVALKHAGGDVRDVQIQPVDR